ncbi:hypothetical protein RND71_036915 [Anisodus tanguticus]|uniref:Cytochrome f n=1 Tax=Anisodus tanguticus TaxID=243964 RepID=A0AAE1R2N7_9SOLA|nr:hypothetical protein RND71_036915 [Anisodus tanguticus]
MNQDERSDVLVRSGLLLVILLSRKIEYCSKKVTRSPFSSIIFAVDDPVGVRMNERIPPLYGLYAPLVPHTPFGKGCRGLQESSSDLSRWSAGIGEGVRFIPTASKSKNTVSNATAAGIVSKIIRKDKGGYDISITDASDGRQVVDIIPPGPELLVTEGESIKFDQPLMSNPNIGGFCQGDAKIVLQDSLRVQGLLFFLASVILAQIFLVQQKKEFEKVQLAEMNF